MFRSLVTALLVLAITGCNCGGGGGGDGGFVDSGTGGGEGGNAGGGGGSSDAGIAGAELMQKLGGLWSGPADQTPLGSFPVLSMDFRAATPHFLFGRTDIDSQNNLRFGLSVETYDGADVLAYRNGGYFQGVLRDSRTKLVDSDGGTYHFCASPQGCGYIDATFSFPNPDSLVFDVRVMGNPHEHWTPTRVETRTLPTPFPADWTSQGDGSAPWPTMPTLNATVNWTTALGANADVWIILTTTNCAPSFTCKASRQLKTVASAGATTSALSLDQVHPGSYKLTALVDKNQNFATTLRLDTGDLLAVDVPLTISTTGNTSTTASATYTVP
ncbi:MAG: hypothetical protein ACJ790_04545 [Myxococcaceae bacterium]